MFKTKQPHRKAIRLFGLKFFYKQMENQGRKQKMIALSAHQLIAICLFPTSGQFEIIRIDIMASIVIQTN